VLDANVARKFAQKSCADAGPENDSENNNCDTDDDEKFSDLRHNSILVSDLVVSSGVALLVGNARPARTFQVADALGRLGSHCISQSYDCVGPKKTPCPHGVSS